MSRVRFGATRPALAESQGGPVAVRFVETDYRLERHSEENDGVISDEFDANMAGVKNETTVVREAIVH